jgi:hypothetical protein
MNDHAHQEHGSPERDQAVALQVLTTEHFGLQTARSAAISESNGRVTLFLSAVSSGVVAIAFVGQTAKFGVPFFTFALVLLVPLLFIGLVTHGRVLQTGIESAVYERGLNRIRHFYIQAAPHAEPYFVLSAHDDLSGTLRNVGIAVVQWQPMFTTAGMVGVVNGVLVGVVAALLVAAFGRGSLAVAIGSGSVTALGAIGLHLWYQNARWSAIESLAPPRFPTPGS